MRINILYTLILKLSKNDLFYENSSKRPEYLSCTKFSDKVMKYTNEYSYTCKLLLDLELMPNCKLQTQNTKIS